MTARTKICRYSDTQLMERFMRQWKPGKIRGQYLWSRVMEAFCCGSTVAREICIDHGYDPDIQVTQRRL